MKKCKVKSCNNNYYGLEFCVKHYCQFKKHGKILKRTRFDKNEVIEKINYYEIVLYKGLSEQKEVARAKINKEDYSKIKDYKVGLNKLGYPVVGINGKMICLHQLILGKKTGHDIDHINGIKIDNRKQNLRHCTRSQNLMNQRDVKGYYWHKQRNKWHARIYINKKQINLGLFKNEQDAIRAREQGEIKYFKEFRYNN